MSLFLFFTGFSFWIPDDTMHTARIACIALGIYLFGMVYSPGEGMPLDPFQPLPAPQTTPAN
jgi:hypothetical protein